MPKGKNVLTTGDISRICNVAARTVSKWFDSGLLKGYRIPGSKDRRVPMNELIRFMKYNNIPMDSITAVKTRIVIVDSNKGRSSKLEKSLREKDEYEVKCAQTNFEAGSVTQDFEPHVMLVSLISEDIEAMNICKDIRSNKDLETIKVIALANHLSNSEAKALMEKGFDGFISDPLDIDEVVRAIEHSTAIVY